MRLNMTLTLTKEFIHQYLNIIKHHIVHIYFLYLQNIGEKMLAYFYLLLHNIRIYNSTYPNKF